MQRWITVDFGSLCRRAAALAATLLILGLAGTAAAHAQAAEPFCGELNEADCALLNDAYETMREVTSLRSELEMELLIDNLPQEAELPIQEFTLFVTQETAYQIEPSANEALAELRELLADPNALEINFARVLELYFETILGITLDSTFELSFSEEVAALIEAEAEFPIPNSFEIGSRVVDGGSYTNIGDLIDLFPGVSVRGDIWFGIEVTALADLLAELDGLDEVFADLASELEEDEALTSTDSLLLSQYLLGDFNVAGGPLLPSLAASELTAVGAPYLMVERLDDEELDGSPVAVFRTAIDYRALFADPEVETLLVDLLQNEELLGADTLAADEAESVAFLVGIYGPEILQDLNLEVIEMIDPATQHHVATEVVMDWDLTDLAAVAAIAGEEFALDSDELPSFVVSATTRYTEIGEPVSVDAPETAIILDFEDIVTLIEAELEDFEESLDSIN